LKKVIFSSVIAMVLVSVLMMPLTAGAANTDVTTLSGTVGSSISVTSPETIVMPSLVAGTNVESTAQTVIVETNTTGWSLYVTDTSGDEQNGSLSKADGTDMGNPLEIKGGDISGYMYLSSSSQPLKNGGTPGTTNLEDIFFRQQVPSNAATGEYSITLTFTATPGS